MHLAIFEQPGENNFFSILLDPERFISDVTNFTQNIEKINMMKSTDGLYVFRLPIDFMLERSIERGNLRNTGNWKRHIFWCEELGLKPEDILLKIMPWKEEENVSV